MPKLQYNYHIILQKKAQCYIYYVSQSTFRCNLHDYEMSYKGIDINYCNYEPIELLFLIT